MQDLHQYLTQHLDKNCIVSIFDEINSTNDFLLKQANQSNPQICITKTQTAGRGQYQRVWQDNPSGCFLLSIKYQFPNNIQISGLSLLVGLSVIDALKQIIPLVNVSLKWPNDIYHQQQKLAGILIENQHKNQQNNAVIGIGINQSLPDNFACTTAWTDLRRILNRHLTKIEEYQIYAQIIKQVLADISIFEQKGFMNFKNRWQKVNYLKGKKLQLDNKQIYQVNGVAIDGALLLTNINTKTPLSLYNSNQICAILT